ncbi:MAG: hypothetical protein Q8K31_06550 [Burkholderiaceae bacterium]|nr:hypothetical protein [Burkholderiaceae bacterium]MDO9090721.1 hypothetical protein [Burkholderiaceae bacterium]MDP1968829.1 hypothetical protein [Burkholderiaceae bacterium]
MHSAPSVFYPVERSRGAAVGLAAVWLCAALTTLLWWLALGANGWPQVAGLLVLLLSALLAANSWRSLRSGHLGWDGNEWQWAEAGKGLMSGGLAHPCLDLQHALLLRLRDAEGAARWIWLERSTDPTRWDDLRRAVCAHGATASGSQAPRTGRETGLPADRPHAAP